MSEYQIIQFEGCSCVVIAPEDIEAKDAEIADLRKRAEAAEDSLKRANLPWRVSLSLPDPVDHYVRHECKIIDVGYSDRVLIVECEAAEAALAESARAGERLGELLSDWQHWYREDLPRLTRVQLEAKTDAALAAWRARK